MHLASIANKLRREVLKMTSEAGSGHPTSCMSCAEIISTLFFKVMRYNPEDPTARNQDVFILSKGHAAPILYAAYNLAGVKTSNLDTLRRFDSELEGHPTPRFPWVRVATGSLGQGLSVSCGAAYTRKIDGVPGIVYTLLGDGEVAEGSVWEAANFASHYKLSNLVAIVDVNSLGQSGPTMFRNDIEAYQRRFEAFGWKTICCNGHDTNMLEVALLNLDENRPTAIIAKTVKGKGVSFLENKDGWHGKALKKGSELELALKEIPDSAVTSKVQNSSYDTQADTQILSSLKSISVEYKLGQEVATREAYGNALVKLGKLYPNIYVVDGDVKNSTFAEKFKDIHSTRFIEMYIAEQNMIGVALGLATEGKIPFASSFACFLTRAFDFIRMAAYSVPKHLIVCGSHAGVSIGEDGPSQMGLEDISMMRSIFGSKVLYPSDAVSSEKLTEAAIQAGGIVYIRTTRPKTKVLYNNDEEFKIGGSKIIRSSPNDVATIVTAGITTHEALKAYEELRSRGISVRIVDLYSIKPVDTKTLLDCAKSTRFIITVEDHGVAGGIGETVAAELAGQTKVHILAVRDIPRSGKPKELMDAYGISSSAIVTKILEYS